MVKLRFFLHKQSFALVRLPPGLQASQITWASGTPCCIVGSPIETTVVCEESLIPSGLTKSHSMKCLRITDESDLDSVGVVANAAQCIAAAHISLFAYSTWSADMFFVGDKDINNALDALRTAGHEVIHEE